jgi:hypothetical protein
VIDGVRKDRVEASATDLAPDPGKEVLMAGFGDCRTLLAHKAAPPKSRDVREAFDQFVEGDRIVSYPHAGRMENRVGDRRRDTA